MILVMGELRFGPGEGVQAAALLAAHAETVRTEQGCEFYAFSFDAADPDLVRVSERWATPEALAAHGQAEHQRAFGRSLRQFTIADRRVDAWEGEFWRNLIGARLASAVHALPAVGQPVAPLASPAARA